MSNVYVAGSMNMDLSIRTGSFLRPGETLLGVDFAIRPGGKGANQAVACARLGSSVTLFGKTGRDAFAAQLLEFLRAEKVNVDSVLTDPVQPTGVAMIVVTDGGENGIVVASGANDCVSPHEIESLEVERGAVVLTQFELPTSAVEALLRHAKRAGATSVLNAAPIKAGAETALALADVIVLNELEAAAYGGMDSSASQASQMAAMQRIRSRVDQAVVITLGAEGVVALVGDQFLCVPGHHVTAVDTTGAGDTFTGALASHLAAGSDFESALHYANAAAAISVCRPGAAPSAPTHSEVEAFLAERSR